MGDRVLMSFFFCVFFNDRATTEIYPLSLHDALPIWTRLGRGEADQPMPSFSAASLGEARHRDRKGTRLNSSHLVISYAVFCLKKNKALYRPQISTTVSRERARRLPSR